MDYSQAHEDEHPEASPWASSPQHSKTGFNPSQDDDPPSSPLERSSYSDMRSPPLHRQHEDSPYDQRPAQQEHHDEEQEQSNDAEDPTITPGPQSQGQIRRGQRYHTQPKKAAQQYKLQAKITALERTGKKDPILRFDVYTNLPKFRTTQFRDVRRTHSEFVKLAEHLVSANPEALVPAVPPPVTSAGAGTEEDENRVKNGIQRWLNVVCSNEVLMRDEEMIFFVESDFGYSPVVRRKQPATGMRRKVIKQFAPPPDDTPELADARPIVKLFYLGTMDTGQKIDKVVKSRRNLGLAISALGQALGQLAPQETHGGLGQAYKKLGGTVRAVGDLQLQQGTVEASSFKDSLEYHSNDAFIVKETLTNRQILMRDLLQAHTTHRSKVNAADRLRSSSTPKADKVDEAIAALEDAKSNEEILGKKVAAVTRNLIGEKRQWFERTAADLKVSIREYVTRQIEAERRTLATLEVVRPDIRAIDGTGGLSRLGRDHHPQQIRRSSLASSQGPKGDAWSGVQRRPDGVRRAESGAGGLPVPEEAEGEDDFARKPTSSNALKGIVEDDDDDRVDARNAASRLAQTTF